MFASQSDNFDVAGRTFYVWVSMHRDLPDSSFLMDTGANVSLISKRLYDDIPEKDRPELSPSTYPTLAGNSSTFTEYGSAVFNIQIQGVTIQQQFRVVEMSEPGIIGIDLMYDQGVTIDVRRRRLFLSNKSVRIHDVTGKPFHSKVVAAQTVDVGPGNGVIISGQVRSKGVSNEKYVYLEPAKVVSRRTGASLLAGVVKANKSIVQVGVYNITSQPIRIYKHTTLGVLHEFDQSVMWRNDKEENNFVTPETHPNYPRVSKISLNTENKVPEHLSDLYQRTVKNLSEPGSVPRLGQMCERFGDVWSKNSNDFGRTNLVKHHIDTGDAVPFHDRPRRIPEMQVPIIKKTVNELYEKGIIRPSKSSWSANSVLVKKKDTGTPQWRMCVDFRGLNERTRNTDPYPLPRIDDTLDNLKNAKFFCTLDVTQGYHQVELTEESKAKTAFCTPRMTPSHWEYNFMPFGIQGGPATFQRLMDTLLFGMDYGTAMAYLDDIIICGRTEVECFDKLEKVLARLERAGLKLKPAKCHLFERQTSFLGHIVSQDGVACDPTKIKAVQEWRAPRTVKQVRAFVGTVGYYKRFIKDFAKICRPLHNLTKKGSKFKWTDECESAFQALKSCLISAPIIAYPQDQGLYVLDTDASAYAIGGVLSQMQMNEDSGKEEEKVIAYASRVLQPRETRYCARRRELLAIVHFVKHFRPYLYGRKVLIRTDHASLRYIKTLKDPNDQFARWIMRLEEVEYTIETRKGVMHANADGLSRLGCGGKRCICDGVNQLEATTDVQDTYIDHGLPINAAVFNNKSFSESTQSCLRFPTSNAVKFGKLWTTEEMQASQQNDQDIGPILNAKLTSPDKRPEWSTISHHSAALKSYWAEWDRLIVINGQLYRRWESNNGCYHHNQLVLPYVYRHQVLQQLHDARTACHMGLRRTFLKIQDRFHWHRMKEYIHRWIRTCDRCQRRKAPGRSARAPLVNYTVGCPMERIAMDICGPTRSPSKKGYNYILVITDYFSKWVDAYPLVTHTARDIAEVLVTRWITYWGCPMSIHTDRGADFDSKLMHEVCDLLKIEKTRTTSYHPSGDGQVEKYNSTMCQMLSSIIDENNDWDELLPYVLMAYRATVHSATEESPNMVMLGRQNALPIDVMTEENPELHHVRSIDYVNRLEEDMRYCHQRVRECLKRAALRQKRYYDRKHHLNQYKRGDLVYKRMKAGLQKFGDRWEGPFVVIDKLSDVTYRIQKSPKHQGDVVHHDLLKLHYARNEAENDTRWIDNVIDRRNYRRNYIQDKRDDYAAEPVRNRKRSRRAEQRSKRKEKSKGNRKSVSDRRNISDAEQIMVDEGPFDLSSLMSSEDNSRIASHYDSSNAKKQVRITVPNVELVDEIKNKRQRCTKPFKGSDSTIILRSPKCNDQRQNVNVQGVNTMTGSVRERRRPKRFGYE